MIREISMSKITEQELSPDLNGRLDDLDLIKTEVEAARGSSANLDARMDAVDSQLAQIGYGVSVYNSANISIPNNVATALTFNSKIFDSDLLHNISTNPSRLTCKKAGLYLVSSRALFEFNATGIRDAQIRKNGNRIVADCANLPPNLFPYGSPLNFCLFINLSINDYLEFVVYQNSGASLNIVYNIAHDFSPYFGMIKVG